MGRTPAIPETPVEPLLARITNTETGYSASLTDARSSGAYRIAPAGTPWFWKFATPTSARRMRRDGHKAVGTLTTTWYPPQLPGGIIIPNVPEPEGAWQPAYDPETDDDIIGVVGDGSLLDTTGENVTQALARIEASGGIPGPEEHEIVRYVWMVRERSAVVL